MKRVILVILFLGICTSQSLQAGGSNESMQLAIGISASFGNVGFFYNALSPYGEWIELETGFHVWRPQHVRFGWRPYLYGRWRWTDYGWYWVSSEPFGWAVFHYGRWFRDDYYGWVWVPDRVWGPSWVEWRYDDDYIGWAPLPPYASFSFSIGIRFTTHWIAPIHYWSFVRHRHFNSPYIVREVVPVDYTRRLIRTTRSAGRYEVEGDRIINRGVDRSFIERRGNTRIDRVDVREATERGERIIRDRSRERIEVYRPNRSELERSPERIDARRAERGTSLDIRRIERPRRESEGTIERGEGERRISRDESRTRPEDRTIERPDLERRPLERQSRASRRDEGVEQRRETRELQIPQPRTFERRDRETERRREEWNPFPRREQTDRQPERRETSRERAPQQQRREVAPPRMRMEAPRAAPRATPETRRESPRGSEPGRRDGGRRRD